MDGDRPPPARPRNVHCSICGDTRGGPVGHEISECTYRRPPAVGLHRFDSDPEALAWARGKVEKVRDHCLTFEKLEQQQGNPESARWWRRFAHALEKWLIGTGNCTIASFDERKPAVMAAIGEAPRTVTVSAADLDMVMNHAGDPARVADYPAAAMRIRQALEGARHA
jgi:hypothetical protein